MARYFFDMHDGEIVRDEVGVDLPGEDEAQKVAVEKATDHLKRWAKLWSGTTWTMRVFDAHRAEVFSMDFKASYHLKRPE